MESDPLIDVYRPATCMGYLQDCIDRFRNASWDDPCNRKIFCAKVCVSSLALTGAIYASITGFGYQTRDVNCIWDGLFKATASANEYLREHDAFRHASLIISSLLIDILAVCLFTRFVLYATSWRTFICLVMFYSIRGVIQTIFVMEFPEGYIWDYPGFPSLVVNYADTSDFFYSGHMGFIVINFFDNLHYRNYFLVGLASLSFVFEFIVLLFARVHYTIDLFAGVVMGHYCWILSANIAIWVDRWIGPKDSRDYYVRC